jgi:DNA-binding NtrC family response regulator
MTAKTSGSTVPLSERAPLAFIIDDDRTIRVLIEMVLARLGIESALFDGAQPAIAALANRRPQIAFLDIALANSDAIDVLKGMSAVRYDGIIQLVSGANPTILESVQRFGLRQGLRLAPPLHKPFRGSALRRVVAPLLAGAAPSSDHR